MQDFIFVFFTILVITGLIYFLYTIVLGSDKKIKDMELQITSDEILQQLNILYKQGKLSIVESLAKNYLKNKSADDDVRFILAKALFELGDTRSAIEQIKTTLKHQPRNSIMQMFLANCYSKAGEQQNAIDILKDILIETPGNVVALKTIANLYNQTNQKISALKMYKKLEEFLENPNDIINNKKTIANIHLSLNDYNFAIEEYKAILEISPEDIFIKKCIIEVCKVISNYEEIITYANEIINSQPTEKDILWAMEYLMDTYINLKDYEKALELANLIAENPLSDKVEAGENIAKILFEKDQLDESIEVLHELIEQQPENIQLKKHLAKAYEKNLNFKHAINIYKDILNIVEPKEMEQIHFEISILYSNWGEYLFSQENVDECFKMFTNAIEYYEKNPNLYYKLGNINKKIKNFNEAISLYKKATELDSENFVYYEAIAECYEEMGSIYEQKKFLTESLKYKPDNSNANYKLGLISYSQNDINAAISYMEKAVNLDDSFIEAKLKLALMFEHIGKKENAINLYEAVLNLDPQNETALNNLKMLKSF